MSATRPQLTINYRTAIKRTFVQALQSVFTANYVEPEFRSLPIYPDYAYQDTKYPLIMVRYHPQRNDNAGVGHVEHFPDSTGFPRPWGHRRFDGSIEFVCQAKSTLSRDILVDSVIEILAFGRLSSALTGFFTTVYGDPSAPYSLNAYLVQLHANTDLIQEGGDSQDIAPWRPEDTLIYEGSVIVPVFGGFYNMVPDGSPAPLVTAVDVVPYLFGETPPSDPAAWLYSFVYDEAGEVDAKAIISGHNS